MPNALPRRALRHPASARRTKAVGAVLTSVVFVGGCGSSASTASGPASTAESSTSAAAGTTTTAGSTGAAADPASASAPVGENYVPTGPLVADSGFRPEKDGFKLQNYGNQLPPDGTAPANLTSAEMRKLGGDVVCVDASSGKCDLTPEAQAWMDKQNNGMSGGHCYGFSVTALLLYEGKIKASDFGAGTTPTLDIPGNTPLQQQIALDFATQFLPQEQTSAWHGTASDLITKLKEVLKPGSPDTYSLGLYKRDGTGGHEITPYAVEDAGGGTDRVLVYDNNFPLQTRALTVDTNKNTWTYVSASDPKDSPEVYDGDATTKPFDLDPSSAALTPDPALFAGKAPNAATQSALHQGIGRIVTAADSTAGELDDVYLEGSDTVHGHLLITDSAGHRLGIVGGKLVEEIPGAKVVVARPNEDWLVNEEPEYYVPDGQAYTITLDGSPLKATDTETVGMISPYFDLAVKGIALHPGETDTLSVGADATKWSYKASQDQAPEVNLGISDTNADWSFAIKGAKVPANTDTSLELPGEGNTLTFATAAGAPTGNFDLKVDRSDEKGVTHFEHSGIQIAGGDTAALDFGSFVDGQPLKLHLTPAGGQAQDQDLSDQAS